MLTLNVEKRDPKTKLDELRKNGLIPAVFYGRETESSPITVSASDFKSVWKEAGHSSLITLKGLKGDKDSIIHDMDIDPVSSQVRHIDFYVVKSGQVMETTVPLEFVGESIAVKSLGGVLIKVLRELNIKVLPKDLPQQIEVDITSLAEIDSQICIKDLKLPAGVIVTDEPDEVIVAVNKQEEETETSEPMDISSVEIAKKGKKEEESAE